MKLFLKMMVWLTSLGFFGFVIAMAGFAYLLDYYGRDLPDYGQLKNYEPPIVTRLYAGDGRLMAEFAQEKRVFIPIEFIPDHVKQAFIAAEDQNYYEHSGVDMYAVARAVFKNVRNKVQGVRRRPEGASTIPQQVAKNFFFTSEVSYERKLKEAIVAYRMNKTLGKDQILELYLNQIYLGGGAYGVGAAALHYFDKSLEELNISEAAYLAALPKAPNKYHPVKHYDRALNRRNWVIGRMMAEGYITKPESELAQAYELSMKTNSTERIHAPYFTEEVRRELQGRYGEDSLYKGGLAVKTSINPEYQNIAQQTLRNGLMAYDKRHGWRGPVQTFETMDDWRKQLQNIVRPEGMLKEWELAVVLEVSEQSASLGFVEEDKASITLENTKWARKHLNQGYALGPVVKSMVQVLSIGDVVMVNAQEIEKKIPVKQSGDAEGQPEGASKTFETVQETIWSLQQIPQIQGGLIALDPHTGRVLAMQGGWNYRYGGSEFNRATQAQRQPGSAFKPFVYLAALDKGFTPATLVLDAPFVLEDEIAGTWKPTNYSNNFYGPTPIRVGIEKSRNLMTVRLADFLGMDLISEYSDHFGITDKMRPLLANSLGATETTLLRMTASYGMLVNGGKKITPTFIDRIQDRHGKTVFKHDKRACGECGDLVKWKNNPVPVIADNREQIADPRTAHQMVSMMEGVVKRGTGVRLRSLKRPVAGKTGTTNESRDAWFIGFTPNLVVGVYTGFDNPRSLGEKETGSTVAVPIFKDFMQYALKDVSPVPFRRPSGIRNIRINAETGARARPGDKKVIWEAFLSGTEPTDSMYILDERGISVLHNYGHYNIDVQHNPSSSGYNASSSSTQRSPSYKAPPTQSSAISTGTGGLY